MNNLDWLCENDREQLRRILRDDVELCEWCVFDEATCDWECGSGTRLWLDSEHVSGPNETANGTGAGLEPRSDQLEPDTSRTPKVDACGRIPAEQAAENLAGNMKQLNSLLEEPGKQPSTESCKTRRQLRAEAVERIRNGKAWACVGTIKEMIGFKSDEKHTDGEWRDALIDLLSEDEPMGCDECGGALHRTPNQPTSQSDAPKTAETAENDASKYEIRDFGDTREKLEADVMNYYTHTVSTAMWPDSANKKTKYVSVSMDQVLGWLDRQKAIAEREQAERIRQLEQVVQADKDDCVQAFADVARLTAERDRFKELLNGLEDTVENRDAIIATLKAELADTRFERNKAQKMLNDAVSYAQAIEKLMEVDDGR